MRDEKDLIWLNSDPRDFWWTANFDSMRFWHNGDNKPTSFQLQEMKATTDTGTSCTYLPVFLYDVIEE
jgi:hypothetical protein